MKPGNWFEVSDVGVHCVATESTSSEGPMESYYSQWSSRVSHLEVLRHGWMVFQFGATGYLLSVQAEAKYDALHSVGGHIVLIGMGVALNVGVCLICQNLFNKSMRAAMEAMIIEYRTGTTLNGSGYYSFRRESKRLEFLVLAHVPGLLTAAYLLAARFELTRRFTSAETGCWTGFLSGTLLSVIFLAAYCAHRTDIAVKTKDRCETWLRQHMQPSGTDLLGRALYERRLSESEDLDGAENSETPGRII